MQWEGTSRLVLTMQWVEGTPIEPEALRAAGHDLAELARHVLRTFLTHALRDGFFHADMHQGNLRIAADGTLVHDGSMSGEDPKVTRNNFIYRGVRLTGFMLGRFLSRRSAEEIRAIYADLGGQVMAGKLSAPVDTVYPIENIKDALAHADKGGRNGKILVWEGPVKDVLSPVCIDGRDGLRPLRLGSHPRLDGAEALKALDALKVGNIGLMGATGTLLEDTLMKLRALVDKSLPEIRLSSGMTTPPSP